MTQRRFHRLAAVAAAMLLSLAGCGDTGKDKTDADIAQEDGAAEPVSISAEEYAAMGMTSFATVDELEKAAGFEILSLDGAAAFADYTAEEIVLDGGKARVRCAADADNADGNAAGGDAENKNARRVIIMEAAPEGTLDTSERAALANISVGGRLVTIAENEGQSLKQAWWSADGHTYTVDTFNVEYADFKTLLETLCE